MQAERSLTLLLSSYYFAIVEKGDSQNFEDKPATIGATEVPARLRRCELAPAQPGWEAGLGSPPAGG